MRQCDHLADMNSSSCLGVYDVPRHRTRFIVLDMKDAILLIKSK